MLLIIIIIFMTACPELIISFSIPNIASDENDNMIIGMDQFDNAKKIQATNSYILQLTSNNTLTLFNNSLVSQNVFIRQFVATNAVVLDFSLTNNNINNYAYAAVLLSNYQFIAVNLDISQPSLSFYQSKAIKIKLIGKILMILTLNKQIFIYDILQTNQSILNWNFTTQFDLYSIDFTFCVFNKSYSIAFWDKEGRMMFAKCQLNNASYFTCGMVNQINRFMAYSWTWDLDLVNFDSTCQYAVYERDSTDSIKIFDYRDNLVKNTKIYPNQIVHKVEFYGGRAGQLMVYYSNNSVSFYQYYQKQPIFKGQLRPSYGLTKHSFYVSNYQQILTPKDNKIYWNLLSCDSSSFMEQYCQNYNDNCSVCEFDTYECIESTGECLPPPINSENYEENQEITEQEQKKSSQFLLNINDWQKYIYDRFISPNVQLITMTIFLPFMLAQSLPWASFLMGFLNYWSICSLYALTQISKPEILSNTLDLVYDAVNFSTFTLLNINTNISSGLQNYFEGTFLQKYEISSVFIEMHMQDIIKFSFSIFLILVMHLIKQSNQKDTWLYRKLSSNYSFMILAQYFSFMTCFFLPSRVIMKVFSCNIFTEKINFLLHFIFIGFSIILPFLIRPFITVKVKRIENYSKISYKIKQQKDYKELFYCGLCSSLFPFIIINGKIYLLCLFGFCLFLKGVNDTTEEKEFRTNKIILSLHPLLFHVSFSLMYTFREYNEIYNLFGLFCILFLLIGGLHEVINLLFEILYPIIKKCLTKGHVKDSNPIKKKISDELILKVNKQIDQKQKNHIQSFTFNKQTQSVDSRNVVFKILTRRQGTTIRKSKLQNFYGKNLKIHYKSGFQSQQHSINHIDIVHKIQFKMQNQVINQSIRQQKLKFEQNEKNRQGIQTKDDKAKITILDTFNKPSIRKRKKSFKQTKLSQIQNILEEKSTMEQQ